MGAARHSILRKIYVCRSAFLQPLMPPFHVVHLKITSQSGTGGTTVGIVVQIHFLVLDAPPQSLDEDVVQRPASTIHADSDPVRP